MNLPVLSLDDLSLKSFPLASQSPLSLDVPCRALISLDYDGTLREEQPPHIEKAFFELMREWRPLGIRWGINTGRSLSFLFSDYREISDIMPDFICTCERYVYMVDEKSGILRAAVDYNERCAAEAGELTARYSQQVQAAFAHLRISHPDIHWEGDDADPLSLIAADNESMEILLPALEEIARNCPGLALQRATRYMRYCDARHHKGSALRHVAETWGVAEKDCFIMGDGSNDLDAFRSFPCAYNAAPRAAHISVHDYLRQQGGRSDFSSVTEALLAWRECKKG